MAAIQESNQKCVGSCHFGSRASLQGLQIGKFSLYRNNFRLHVDSQVICNSLWYLMCLNARIRPALESWDNSITGQDADATFRNVSDIYVIILLRYFLRRHDALMLKECRCPVPLDHHRRCLHCAVQETINVLWFQCMNEVSSAYQQDYHSMPIPVVALAITVVRAYLAPDHFCY